MEASKQMHGYFNTIEIEIEKAYKLATEARK
jgi:hypothetical protein